MIPPRVIECDFHEFQPWITICSHLIERTSSQWLPVPITDYRESFYDWLCPICYMGWKSGNEPVEDLRIYCVSCAAQLERSPRRIYKITCPIKNEPILRKYIAGVVTLEAECLDGYGKNHVFRVRDPAGVLSYSALADYGASEITPEGV